MHHKVNITPFHQLMSYVVEDSKAILVADPFGETVAHPAFVNDKELDGMGVSAMTTFDRVVALLH